MLFYVLRVVIVLLRQLFRARVRPTDTFDVPFRAWPWSCDLNFHVNNAQYLYFMELARWAFTLRTGLLRQVYRDQVQLLVAGTSILYRRPIGMLRRFTLRTRLLAADRRWFYFLHEAVDHRGEVAMRAVLRGMARKGSLVVAAADVFGDLDLPAPEKSDELQAFDALARLHLSQLS